MKKHKAAVLAILAVLTFMSMQACMGVDDDLSDGPLMDNTAYKADLATIITFSNTPGETLIERDNEGQAYVVNPAILSRNEVDAAGSRIFFRYIYEESPFGPQDSKAPYVRITELQKVLTKDLDTLGKEEEDAYGQDPINYIAYNLSQAYLTLQFQIYGSNANIKHRISLVADEGATPDANGLLSVELRHNAEGDRQEFISQPGYVSFPLSGIPGYKEGTLKGFKMEYLSFNKEKKTVTISYNNSKATKDFLFAWEAPYNTKIE